MKNYILTLLFALVALTGCTKDEYYYKTPGEITGEKITELLESGDYMSRCKITMHFSDVRNFTIEGQFLHVHGGQRTLTFNLNQLIVWSYIDLKQNAQQNYFSFTFLQE